MFIESINVFFDDDFVSFSLLKYSSTLSKLIFFFSVIIVLYLSNFSTFSLFSLFFSNSSLFFLSINSISLFGFCSLLKLNVSSKKSSFLLNIDIFLIASIPFKKSFVPNKCLGLSWKNNTKITKRVVIKKGINNNTL